MDRCPLCPGINRCIPLDPSCNVLHQPLFIGEAPGVEENRKGVVFIGKTGEEVNRHYLPLAGLRRESTAFTNAIKCLPISTGGKIDISRSRDMALLESCTKMHLYQEIERVQPSVLIPMGTFACRAISPDINLELQHGFPQPTKWGIPAFPMYHPALGIHEPKKMLYLRTDWIRLKAFLRNTLQLPSDPYPTPDYQEVTDASEFRSLNPTRSLAIDTEYDRHRHPYCLTFSNQEGTGRLLRATRTDLLDRFQRALDQWEAPILFHNWLADAPIVAAMGLRIPHRRIIDTMVRVFHLGNLPQGLKALALRELGMEMKDWEDMVIPYSRPRVVDYYRAMNLEEWGKPEPQLVQDTEGKWRLYKPQSLNTKLKRFFTDYTNDPNRDVSKAWTDNWEAHHVEVQERLGPWPGLCITHVPFEEVLPYACRDADATLRLWWVLRKMQRMVRRTAQENWRAA